MAVGDKLVTLDGLKAVYQDVNGNIVDLKSALDEYVIDKYALSEPENWFNANDMTTGNLYANGTTNDNSERQYTNYYIPVEYGKTIYFRRMDTQAILYFRHITVYNSEKTRISGGVDSNKATFEIPEGAAYVRVTVDKPISSSIKPMIYVGTSAPTVYSEYFAPHEVVDEDFVTPETEALINRIKNGELDSTDFANSYCCSLPKKAFKMTKGIAETFYYFSAASPFKTTFLDCSAGLEYGSKGNDCIVFPNTSTLDNNVGYTWFFRDYAYNMIDTFPSTSGSRKIIEENLSDCSLLAIGDSTVDQDYLTAKLLAHFTEQEVSLTLLGTLGSGDNKNEGRAGWKAADYFTDRQYDSVTNPFYNPTSQTFDFSYYMTNQGYSAPDFVVIQLGLNDIGASTAKETIWSYISGMIDSILDYSSSIKILLNLPNTPNSDQSKIQQYLPNWVQKTCAYNAYAQAKTLEEYSADNVRTTYCHLILNPATDIVDNIHPTEAGYNKMALEIVNQINHWQNGD